MAGARGSRQDRGIMVDRGAVEEVFGKVYDEVTGKAGGAFLPKEAASLMAAELTSSVDSDRLAADILNIFHNPDSAGTIYPGSFEVLRKLLEEGHIVTIWTQGDIKRGLVDTESGQMRGSAYQIHKIRRSGVQQVLGQLWRRQVKEFSIPRVIGGIDKHQALGDWIDRFKLTDLKRVVVVDDKAKNLTKARNVLSGHLPEGVEVEYVLCQMQEKGRVDDSGQFKIIRGLKELMGGEKKKRTAFLIDWDYVVMDHGKVRKDFVERIAALVSAKSE